MIAATHWLYAWLMPKKLLDSVTLIVMALVVVLLVAMGGIFSQFSYDIIEKQTQKKAVLTAKNIALQPGISTYLRGADSRRTIPTIAEEIRKETEADYVLITDQSGKILFHTDQGRINRRITSAISLRPLQYGRVYTEYAKEKGHTYIRGATPIFGPDFSILGMVATGFSTTNIKHLSQTYLDRIIFFTFVFITVGLIASSFIAKGIKLMIFGMEPSEIAHLFYERTALIESIKEGIISTDPRGYITLVNQRALQNLQLNTKEEIFHNHISKYFQNLDFKRIIDSGEPLTDKEFVLNHTPVIVNAEQVGDKNGLVVSFRPKEDIDILARELSQVKQFSEMLRAQTHEFSNCLHTIVGMLQIGAYEDVLQFIAAETVEQRKLIRLLAEKLPDRILSSLVIGKYMHAQECKLLFVIDPESQMVGIPDNLDRQTVATALGNILDNAFDAALKGDQPPQVSLFMSDFGPDLLFEVEDSGKGINPSIQDRLFHKGISTKSEENHGYGLYIAKQAMDTLGGQILFASSPEEGTRFELVIPKKAHTLCAQ